MTVSPPAPSRPFGFRRRDRARFVASYVRDKTVGMVTDVRSHRLRLAAYEWSYSMARVAGRRPAPLRGLQIDEVDSRFGRFAVRPGTIDVACASPAFERPDVDRLLAELDRYRAAGRAVTFLDIGADLGTYTVTVARHDPAVTVVAFEPAYDSHQLLARNVDMNGVADRVHRVRAACGDGSVDRTVLTFDAEEPGSSGVRADLVAGARREQVVVTTVDATLDGLPEVRRDDVVVLKLDVEGYEVPALDGALATTSGAAEALLLVEDFVDVAVIGYLQATGWTFVDKLTPYNSFWRRTR